MVKGDEILEIARQFKQMAATLETGLALAVELEQTGRIETEAAREYVADYITEFIPSAWARINRLDRIQRKYFSA